MLQQLIFFKGNVMQHNDKKLSSYGVKDQDLLKMMSTSSSSLSVASPVSRVDPIQQQAEML